MSVVARVVCIPTDTDRQQFAEASSRWQAIQQQNDTTIGRLQEQTAQLMAFMNSSRATMVLRVSESSQPRAHRVTFRNRNCWTRFRPKKPVSLPSTKQSKERKPSSWRSRRNRTGWWQIYANEKRYWWRGRPLSRRIVRKWRTIRPPCPAFCNRRELDQFVLAMQSQLCLPSHRPLLPDRLPRSERPFPVLMRHTNRARTRPVHRRACF